MGNSKTKPEQSNSKESNENDTSNTSNASNTPNTSIHPQLQIRNCIRNVRNNNGSFTEMFPNEAGASCGQSRSSVYTIDVHNSTPANFTNPGYVSSEGNVKSPSNDGLPTYEEAISGVKTPIAPIVPSAPPPQPRPTIERVSEDSSNATSSRGRRHRHRRHHRHHHHETDGQNENSEPNAVPEESRRHHGRRGHRLRKQLAKINRKNRPETE